MNSEKVKDPLEDSNMDQIEKALKLGRYVSTVLFIRLKTKVKT